MRVRRGLVGGVAARIWAVVRCSGSGLCGSQTGSAFFGATTTASIVARPARAFFPTGALAGAAARLAAFFAGRAGCSPFFPLLGMTLHLLTNGTRALRARVVLSLDTPRARS